MLLFIPARPKHAAQAEATRALIENACRQAASEGVHLAQCLPDPDDSHAITLVQSCGFARLAELLYLSAAVTRQTAPPTLPPGWAWRTYSPAEHGVFAEAVLATYHQSLDCPALNGLRSIDDILEGHQATGEFDPAHWLLLSDERAQAAAVLLLSHIARTSAMELVYLGIAPHQRGRGLGDLLMRQAACVVASTRNTRLSLAVDAGNTPALRLYFRHGMQAAGRKLALMRDLRRPSPHPSTTPSTFDPHVR
jgi:ribosomal protein S18 acetylase RimI-like enzyme